MTQILESKASSHLVSHNCGHKAQHYLGAYDLESRKNILASQPCPCCAEYRKISYTIAEGQSEMNWSDLNRFMDRMFPGWRKKVIQHPNHK